MKINSRNPIALGMLVVGLILLVGAVLFHFLVKPPTIEAAKAKLDKQIGDASRKIAANNKNTANEIALIQNRLWQDADDQIAPAALRRVGDVAKKHGVKLTTFRPQKEVSAGALNLLPFFVSVDGTFPAVYDFVKDLEENNQLLLVVNLVQLTSNDQTSHNVTASVGIDAYLDPSRGTVATTSSATPPNSTSAPKTPDPTSHTVTSTSRTTRKT